MKALLSTLILIFTSAGFASSQDFLFYRQAGGDSPTNGYADRATSIAVDTDGSMVIYGEYIGTSGSGAYFGNTIFGNDGVYVAKYSSSGNMLWVKQSTYKNGSSGGITYSVTFDKQSNCIVTGAFGSFIRLGTGEANVTELTGVGDTGYIAKYSPDGTLMWARSAGGDIAAYRRITSVKTDAAGNVFVGGTSSKAIVFGKGTPAEKTLTSGAFIAKYSSSGDLVWVNQITITSAEPSIGIDKSGNVIVVASAYPTFVLAKYNSSGTLEWKKTPPADGGKLALDNQDNIYVIGGFGAQTKTISYGTGSTAGTITVNGKADMYLFKFNPQGDVQWGRNAGGKENDWANGIAVDSKNNLFITGYIEGDATFGDLKFNGKVLKNSGKKDVFVAKYSTNGDFIWVTGAGGAGDDEGMDIAVDAQGNSCVGGYSNSKDLIFGKGEAAQQTYTALGYNDIFLAKFKFSEEVITAVENTASENLAIYPNPTHETIAFSMQLSQPGGVTLRVKDLSGKELISRNFSSENATVEGHLDLYNLAGGFYILEVSDGKKQWFRKVIIE